NSDAIDNLISLHGEDDEVQSLVALVLRKSDLVQDPAERAALLLNAGDLYAHRLAGSDEAVSSYRGVLDIEPGNVRALEALEVLYGRAEKWDELIDVLGQKADHAPTDAARIAALKKKGLTQHEQKGDTTEAIATFNHVLDIDPTDVEALRTLDRLYSAVEDWNSLYTTLERLYALLGGDEQLTVHYRMGRLLERELGDAIRAVETYQAILDLHPDNRDAVDALEGMVRAGDDGSHDAFRVLAPTLSDRGEWPRLYAVYDAVTEREDDVAHKVTNLLTMGEIAERHMLEPLRAFECYGRAFSADPLAQEALEKLETLADAHGLWDGVPDLLNGAAGTIEGTPDALRLRLHAGRVQRDRLRDLEAAARSFEAVVADFPDNRDALSALDALYVELDKPAELARVLKAEIDATGDADEKVAFLLRLGTVSESRLDSTRAALDARREVLYLKPAQWEAVRELRRMFDAGWHKAEILELLEPIYRDQSEWVDLATVYESVIPAVEDPGERKLVLLRLGETWLERLGDKPAAIGWFGMALALDPGDEALLVQVELLADQAGAWAQYEDVLLAAASSAGEEGERRLYLWHKAADCARDRIGDLGQAEKINKWILDVDAADRQSLSALDAMYEGQGRWHDLLSVLHRECESSSFDDERIGFYMRAAGVQRDRTQDLDGAVESFQAVVRMDDRHRGALEALADLHDVREEHQP
ncbi:MAG: tetratricopeptide repeat protein, partial [Deltaproteobacteria bacterium]|nr:tetratricopeptide repeat protein [Deltaproteobacteria bacterium]